MSDRRHVILGFSIWASGNHPAGWRLPEANAFGTFDPGFLRDTAHAAERGKLDFYFIGDRIVGLPSSQYHAPNEVLRPEALTTAAFIAAATSRIGIITTVNTTYAEPYTTARMLAQLDHLSNGRMAFNIVTGRNEEAAGNFGRESHWGAEKRYAWASEFVEVIRGLWDSWEDDALVARKDSGLFIDEQKVHELNYRGTYFSVNGPLNIQRPPQGHVPILHAGTSEESREFGAKYADIRFILLQPLARAKAYYADIQSRLAKYGRTEPQPMVAGVPIYVAGTAREAQEKFRQIQNLTVAEPQLAPLSEALGVSVTGFPLDTPLSDIPSLSQPREQATIILRNAYHAYGDDRLTLKELALFFGRSRGGNVVVGNGKQVADYIEEQFEERTADGFILFPPYLPGPLDAFVDLVVPELQRRGLFRTEYTETTFREFFGLSTPENQFVAHARAAQPDLRSQHFISADELARLIAAGRAPVLLDVRDENGVPNGRPEYARGHIPGAVYVDLPTELQSQPRGFSGGRPVPEIGALQANARRWGIDNGDTVVVYDNVFGTKAARAWWVLRWAGIRDVRILDGGFAAWRNAANAETTETPEPVPGDVTLTAGHLPALDADGALAHARAGTLFDARSAKQFADGHIPGAIALPTRANLTDDGLLRDEASLRARFAHYGIDGRTPIGVYCGGGVAAAHELAVLTSLGIPATLFVGSFSAWSSDPSRPVERDVAPLAEEPEARAERQAVAASA